MPAGHWSPAATELAISLWTSAPSAADVAAEINRRFGMSVSRKAIIAKMHRCGLSFKGPALPVMLPKGTKGAPRPVRATAAPKAKPAPKPKAAPVLVASVPRPAPRPMDLPESRRVAIQNLRHDECRYIAGDPKTDPTCCGHAVELGSSWCPAHARLCTTVHRPRVQSGFVSFRRAA
nr:GcrA family cell cycle regulator [Methylobacterium sp. BTF04]